MQTRRSTLTTGRRGLLMWGTGMLLGGCGFRLRQAPEMAFERLALRGFRYNSPMADALRQQLRGQPATRLVAAPDAAQAILEALSESIDKSVIPSDTAGLVREIQIRAKLSFRLVTPAGKELLAPAALELSRDMSYNEKDALAKEQEEDLLTRAMLNDIATQVLRRLAAVREL